MEIKPCPFCGSDEIYIQKRYARGAYMVFVKCDFCKSQSGIFNSVTDPQEEDWDNGACRNAMKAWNMRAEIK